MLGNFPKETVGGGGGVGLMISLIMVPPLNRKIIVSKAIIDIPAHFNNCFVSLVVL